MRARSNRHPGHISLLVVAAAVATLAAAASASAFDGVLLAPDGSPLAGARVTVIGRPGSTIADRTGRFTLDGVGEPPFLLLVTRPDGVALEPISVDALPESGPVTLTIRASFEDSVSVISGVVPDLELPPAAAATVIGREDLDQRNPSRLVDVLEAVPGSGRTGEGHAAVPGLRGLPKGRTLILIDEGRVTAERRAGPSATYLDPETVEEVEVVRGPGSVAYGSDAFGGIIRARSWLPHPGEAPTVRYRLTGADATGERGVHAEATADALGGAVLGGLHYREFDDYDSPHGTVQDSGAVEKGFRLGYQALVWDGVLRVGWRTDLARDVGKPGTDPTTRNVYPEEDSHRLSVSFDRPGPGDWSRLGVSASWDSYRLILDKDRAAAGTTSRTVTRSDVDANDYEVRVEGERSLGGARLVVGANAYGRYDLRALNSTSAYDGGCCPVVVDQEVSIASARSDDVGAFVGLGGAVGPVAVAGGARVDRVSSSNDGGYFGDRSTSATAVSGFLAATLPVAADLEVSAQVARGFRDPLLSDRYYRGVTGRGFITGNPDLDPETSLQLDLAARYTRGPVQLAAFAYRYRIRDLVERYKSNGDYFFRNRGEAEIRGIEVEGAVAVAGDVTLRLGGQVLRGTVDDDGTPLDDIPSRGGFVVVRSEPRSGPWWLARVAAWTRDERPGPTERVVPGHAVVDLGAGWRFSAALELELLARNVLDRAYPASADEEAVLAPGRTLAVTMRGRI